MPSQENDKRWPDNTGHKFSYLVLAELHISVNKATIALDNVLSAVRPQSIINWAPWEQISELK